MLHGVAAADATRGMRSGWWPPAIMLMTGCATVPPAPVPPPSPSPSFILLARADGLLVQGDYEQALQLYADFARQYPDDSAAPRARATRDVLGSLAETNREMARISSEVRRMKEQAQNTERELDRLRRDLGTREAELGRVRQELGERQAELARLLTEAEQLRTDLEKLKSVDLRLERRR